ncbi:MAG: Uncharacterized protein G01um101429_1016 [Parcubacteria group bacterium Gr01-1014_29]|nr:MAG: Uncharacterized protein G01um101429_1016 [Parcubacteria group bacterium Gr01-1014_29]
MAFEWRSKRKLIFLSSFVAIILVVGGIVTFALLPTPSCTDKRLNQDEEQVDCGGLCAPCLSEKADNLIILWSRFFEVRPGVYDVATLVENVNLTIGSGAVPYVFELYDARGERIVSRSGSIYTLPNKQFLVFQANLETGIRVPQRVVFRLDPFVWQLMDEQALPVIISRTVRDFEAERPRLIATLTNSALYDVLNVDVAVVISDASGNAIAVSATRIDKVPDSGTTEAAFTWPHPFPRSSADVRFFIQQRP